MSEDLRHIYPYDVKKVLGEYFDQIEFENPPKRKSSSDSYIPIKWNEEYFDQIEFEDQPKRKSSSDSYIPIKWKIQIKEKSPPNSIMKLKCKRFEELPNLLIENNKQFAPEEKYQNEQSRKFWDSRWFGSKISEKDLKSFLKRGCKDEEVMDLVIQLCT